MAGLLSSLKVSVERLSLKTDAVLFSNALDFHEGDFEGTQTILIVSSWLFCSSMHDASWSVTRNMKTPLKTPLTSISTRYKLARQGADVFENVKVEVFLGASITLYRMLFHVMSFQMGKLCYFFLSDAFHLISVLTNVIIIFSLTLI